MFVYGQQGGHESAKKAWLGVPSYPRSMKVSRAALAEEPRDDLLLRSPVVLVPLDAPERSGNADLIRVRLTFYRSHPIIVA